MELENDVISQASVLIRIEHVGDDLITLLVASLKERQHNLGEVEVTDLLKRWCIPSHLLEVIVSVQIDQLCASPFL